MAPRCGSASMARTEDDFNEVLADLQASRSIHFHKTLARRMRSAKFRAGEQLGLPSWFIEEHADKLEEWVIFRTFSSSKPWRIRLSVSKSRSGSPKVRFVGGLREFASDNGLKEGDSLVFVLNVDARSEFQVHIIRTSSCRANTDHGRPHNLSSGGDNGNYRLRKRGADHLVIGKKKKKVESDSRPRRISDLGGSSGSDLESDHGNDDAASDQALRGCSDCKSCACKQGALNSFPSFRRRLTAYHNFHPHRRMEVPASFVKAHVKPRQLQDVVQLQGVHKESPVRTVTCYWQKTNVKSNHKGQLFFNFGWREFVKEIGLKLGQELQFTLTSNSLFTVQVV